MSNGFAYGILGYYGIGVLWFVHACRKEENRDPAVFNWCLNLWPVELVRLVLSRLTRG